MESAERKFYIMYVDDTCEFEFQVTVKILKKHLTVILLSACKLSFKVFNGFILACVICYVFVLTVQHPFFIVFFF